MTLLLLAIGVCLVVAAVVARDVLIDHGSVVREVERRDRLDAAASGSTDRTS